MSELDSSAQKIQSDARIDQMRYNIHDFTAVTKFLLTETDIEFLAARANAALLRNPRLKIAFVGNDPVVYHLMEVFNSVGCANARVVRFDTLKDARAYACEGLSLDGPSRVSKGRGERFILHVF